MLGGPLAADDPDMTEVLRLYDADRAALTSRAQAAKAALGSTVEVSLYTYWYTSRPPMHEAILLRREHHGPRQDRPAKPV